MLENDNSTPMKASEYNEKIAKTIPYYTEFHKQVIEIVRGMNCENKTWLDLGCGTGTFEGMIIEEFPDTKIVALDPSEAMLDEAKKLLNSDNVSYVCTTSEEMSFENEFDVITAIQTHHYLQPDERKKATENVFNALKKDGVYLSFENVVSEYKEMKELELIRWKNYQMQQGKSEVDAQAHIERCDKNYFPIPISEHVKLLKSIGFKNVYVFWKTYMQMGILATK